MFYFSYQVRCLFSEIRECNAFHLPPPNVYIQLYSLGSIMSRCQFASQKSDLSAPKGHLSIRLFFIGYLQTYIERDVLALIQLHVCTSKKRKNILRYPAADFFLCPPHRERYSKQVRIERHHLPPGIQNNTSLE